MAAGNTNAAGRALHRFLASLPGRPAADEADARLVERFLARRAEAEEVARTADEAFEALVTRHGPMVWGVCRRVLRDPADAEDAFQATFLVLFRRAGSVRFGNSLGPWLYGVARRIALRARADRARRGAGEGRVGDRPGRDPAADACRNEVRSVIDEEVGRLPERYRAPVVLCLLEGLKYDEAARRLGCPVGTVGVRLSRGREILRTRLTRRGVAPASAALALTPAAGRAAVAGRLVRAALDAGRVPSPRVAALARQESGAVMFGMKSWGAAVLVSAAVLAGGVAWVAAVRSGPGATEPVDRVPSPGANVAERVDPEPAPAVRPPADADVTAQPGVLVDKHEAQLGRIRSLRYAIDERVSEDGGKTWKTTVQWTVRRDGPRERVRYQQFWVRDRDRLVPNDSHADVLFSPDGVLSMSGYDQAHPPPEPVTPADRSAAGAGRIGGLIRPAQPFGPWGYKGALAADYVPLFLPDPRYSLRDLCTASPNAATAVRRDEQGQALVDLALNSPDGKLAYVVTLSPSHGYAIAQTQATLTGDKSPTPWKSDYRVLEFQEPAPGIFLPKSVRHTVSRMPGAVFETSIGEVSVNASVADQEFAFRFPAGIGVSDLGRNVWYVWGDGVPARTFKSVDEYNEWLRSQLAPGTAPAGAGRYGVVLRELETGYRDFARATRAAKTEAERQTAARSRPDTAAFAGRFLELAKQNPADPSSLRALARAATLSGSKVADEAVELLRKDRAANPAVAEVLLPVGLSPWFPLGTEALLREVLAHNPSREAKAHATYALASILYSLSDVRRLHAQGPKQARGLEHRYGKANLDRLLARDPVALAREADELMTRVASDYADVKLHPDHPKDTQSLSKPARAWLRLEEEPPVGRPAPAFEAKDLNGQAVRLSDYRGKVVVVIFWASWCRPCMNMIPEEKALVARLAGKPFALIGVNCDATAGEARRVAAAQSIPWPNLHDGVPDEGKIAERYKVAGHGIPAIFVVDRDGVLRHKWLASADELDRAVDALLAEGGAARKGGSPRP
jgi:RNA polymerase sigma factor (sigma-70 family)